MRSSTALTCDMAWRPVQMARRSASWSVHRTGMLVDGISGPREWRENGRPTPMWSQAWRGEMRGERCERGMVRVRVRVRVCGKAGLIKVPSTTSKASSTVGGSC